MKAFLYLEKNYLSTSLLNYKQQHNGKLLVKVPPQYTSKTCYIVGASTISSN
ncbi:putative transposase DNA-binding domain protein [Helicobacter pylori R056a]|uniref:Transposase n=2 Tax=Helicobacter pylori TaxID=210 RepID=I9UTK5_HELPX|nr:transposase B-like protein [Helicobacter pylori HPAG1]EJB83439.1 transposase [Helicobacter pylori Hp H-6]EKE80113.1 putative transposase DNA-binding domain protein [Helicobacter pylori R018c]EKE94124.1 putative transposase DNA-binding domain protein [Helicobacter pylori R056a]KOS35791.1 transposase [Helicobacter pylori]